MSGHIQKTDTNLHKNLLPTSFTLGEVVSSYERIFPERLSAEVWGVS
jgi:hypothetical protein